MADRTTTSRPEQARLPNPGSVYPEGPADAMLAASAAGHPSRIAIRDGERALSYAELNESADHCAAALHRLLPGSGRVVAITSLLSIEFVTGYYGILRSGNVVAPVNPYLREEQLANLLGGADAELALVDEAAAARVEAVRDRLPRLREVILLRAPVAGAGPAARTLDELLAEAAESPAGPDRRGPRPDDLACLLFTSGTTGAPKTVMLSHRNVTVNAVQVANAHHLNGSSVVLNHLPTYHPMHMNSAIFGGAAQILCTAPGVAESVRVANSYGATHYYSLPMRLSMLVASEELSKLHFATVRMVASGGSALSATSARRLAEHFGVPVIQGYGLAETSPITHSDEPTDWRPGTVGRPVADTEARIVDVETRAELAVGEPGEVQVRGPQVMLGYKGEAAASWLDADGWLSTGDVGQIDATGRLVLVDRIKDVFKRDNWLVSPTSVERALEQHAAVLDCVVVDHADPEQGAVATAFVTLVRPPECPVTGSVADLIADIAAEVNQGLPYYQHIEHIEVLDAIQRSPNGKVPRNELRARMAQLLRARSPRPGNRPGSPTGDTSMITFVTKFTLKGDDSAEFERLFNEHAAFMADQNGFVDFQLVRSASNPKSYVNIGRWQDIVAHRAVVNSELFRSHVMAMAPLVEVEADLFHPVTAAAASR